ncbi:hypothetical protein EHE21_14095 [Proteus sp. GOKU]|nr:hypothetical protein EHE21_14095 [Proteus sp. GOKU]QQP26447.1 hypothetical protein D7029_14095 [Proteus vulgaris]
MLILLFSSRVLGSIWFKHFASTRKRKAPANILYIHRGGLKHRQFDSASIFIGVQEEMKKYSLIGLMIVTMIISNHVLLESKYLIYSHQLLDI